jgi:hypothetical protein|nr:MAG TPA_asm: helix-turn-helix domain protein [Caudoviricetes sp.]
MSEIKDENFISIQGWMVNRLNLKGNELIAYAVIYGFSQDGESMYTGSRRYLADWCGCSVKTVGNALASLVAKGLISKHDKTVNGVHLCDYSITPVGKNLHGGREKTSLHNIEDNIDVDTIEDKKERKRHSFDAIIDAYTSNATTKELLGEWLQNRKSKRAAMTDNAIKRNIDKLDAYAAQSNMSVDDYLAEVIRRGWNAFYPIKTYQSQGYKQQAQAVTLPAERRETQAERDRAMELMSQFKA